MDQPTASHALHAINPLDGRYLNKLERLGSFTSEAALISYRLQVEAQWLLFLADQPVIKDDIALSPAAREALTALAERKDQAAQARVKEIEATTNHDVKACEYLIREQLAAAGASEQTMAFIHFGCTSEDINNLSYGLMLKELRDQQLVPAFNGVLSQLDELVASQKGQPMLSRTHGQTASPTTLGKELAVFGFRIRRQVQQLQSQPILAKCNGAVGNFNAHHVAYPELDWQALSQRFIENELGLSYNPLTTQIENHDAMAEYFDALKRVQVIAIGLCRDIWGYISLGYFGQQVKAGEVGSSTMPHKVNPIDFENAEGNFGLSIALCQHFGEKLPISRWQRDLSDSTVQRTIGTCTGHTLLALKSLSKGLGKLKVIPEVMAADLTNAYEVLTEAVQTVLRRYGVADAYEQLKALSRGKALTAEQLRGFIENHESLPTEQKKRLLDLTPLTYIGRAEQLADDYLAQLS